MMVRAGQRALCESFEYMTRDRNALSTKDIKTLQERTFYAKEKKSLAYVIGIMNMILHGIEAPNIGRCPRCQSAPGRLWVPGRPAKRLVCTERA
jgi:hypothetical protein